MALSATAGGSTVRGRTAPSANQRGRQLFIQNCASCHTLEDAGATGFDGDLDVAFAGMQPSDIERIVRDQIRTGGGGMPAGILTDGQADAVAAYVASVTGLATTLPGTFDRTATLLAGGRKLRCGGPCAMVPALASRSS